MSETIPTFSALNVHETNLVDEGWPHSALIAYINRNRLWVPNVGCVMPRIRFAKKVVQAYEDHQIVAPVAADPMNWVEVSSAGYPAPKPEPSFNVIDGVLHIS